MIQTLIKNVNLHLIFICYLLELQINPKKCRNCRFCRVFECIQGPQAAAVAISAVTIVHLPSVVVLLTCGDLDADLGSAM